MNKRPRQFPLVLSIVFLLLSSCVEDAPARETQQRRDVRAFLQSWLVDRDFASTSRVLAGDFDSRPAGDPAVWPESLRKAKRSERALRFPFVSGCAEGCTKLDDCVRDLREQRITIGAEQVKQFSDLADRVGETATLVTFVLPKCNYGAVLIFTDDGVLQFVGYSPPE